MEKEI
jgi:hypothetical protein